MLDASTAFQDGWAMYGNEEAATAYMEASLDKIWGVSQTKVPQTAWGPGVFVSEGTTQSVLMRHPPEKHYTGMDGDLGFLYTAMSDFAAAGGASPYGAVLVPDEQTDREVREGKLPTYKVMGMDEFGGAMILEGRFGGPDLQAGESENMVKEAMRVNTTTGLETIKSKMVELDAKIEFARGRGAEPGQVMAMEREKAILQRSLEAETTAAVENGYLDKDALVDPVMSVAKVKERVLQDATLNSRINAMLQPQKLVSEPIARKEALIKLLQKDYKITREMAAEVVKSLLETQE